MIASSVVSECLAMVAPAEGAFRSRWRLSTLARLAPDLHARLAEQIDLYNYSLVTGSDADTREHAAAMVRGWRAACAALEAPLISDDAYLVGFCSRTGTKVVISEQQQSLARAQIVDGQRVLIVSPDEVARMISGLTIISEVKACFPDAEIMSVFPAEESCSTTNSGNGVGCRG